MRVVVVDPDRMAGKLLQFVLTDAGHEVVLTKNAAEGLGEVIGRETDAVLLKTDLPAPGLDGYELCKELRARRYNGPLIFVTQRRETRDKLRAFDFGADDYIVEPFDPLELVARLHSVTRRFRHADYQALGTVLKAGDAELSIGELTFRVEGRPPVVLTPTEMRMLECLMRNSNITISRDTLIERTWGYDFIGDSNRVDVYVRRIRKKVERDPAQPEYIHTIRGLGYAFRPPAWGKILDLRTPAPAGQQARHPLDSAAI
jgi:two-component system, OmpR family, response regulator RegX3